MSSRGKKNFYKKIKIENSINLTSFLFSISVYQ